MASGGATIKLQGITFDRSASVKWRPVKVYINQFKHVWKDPMDNPSIDITIEEGQELSLNISVKRWRLFWKKVATRTFDFSNALPNGTDPVMVDEKYVGNMVLHFSRTTSAPGVSNTSHNSVSEEQVDQAVIPDVISVNTDSSSYSSDANSLNQEQLASGNGSNPEAHKSAQSGAPVTKDQELSTTTKPLISADGGNSTHEDKRPSPIGRVSFARTGSEDVLSGKVYGPNLRTTRIDSGFSEGDTAALKAQEIEKAQEDMSEMPYYQKERRIDDPVVDRSSEHFTTAIEMPSIEMLDTEGGERIENDLASKTTEGSADNTNSGSHDGAQSVKSPPTLGSREANAEIRPAVTETVHKMVEHNGTLFPGRSPGSAEDIEIWHDAVEVQANEENAKDITPERPHHDRAESAPDVLVGSSKALQSSEDNSTRSRVRWPRKWSAGDKAKLNAAHFENVDADAKRRKLKSAPADPERAQDVHLSEADLSVALTAVREKNVPFARHEQVGVYLEVLLNVGRTFSEVDPIANVIMVSVTEIVRIFQVPIQVRDEMLELLDAMSRALPLLLDIDKFETSHQLKKAMEQVKTIMVKSVQFATKWANREPARFRDFLRDLTAKDTNTVQELKTEFQTFIREYDRGLSIETLIRMQDTHKSLLALHAKTQEQDDLKMVRQLTNAYAHDAVMSGDADHCLQGTRQNILDDIMAWADAKESPNILWLKSMPGAGKSTIARSLVRELKQRNRHGANFFFSRDDVERRTPFALWCHILYSLSVQFPAFRREVCSHIRHSHFEIGSSQAEEILDIIVRSSFSFKESGIFPDEVPVLVIDALDECPKTSSRVASPRQSVLEALVRWSTLAVPFKIIVTSREDSGISDMLSSDIAYPSHLHTGKDADAHSSADIRHFISHRLRERLAPGPNDNELAILSDRAAGLFIWASAAVRFILKPGGFPKSRLERLLRNEAPDEDSDELSKLYHVLLMEEFTATPDDEMKQAFQQVVGTIVMAATPLTLSGIVGLLPDLKKEQVEQVLHHLEMVTSTRTQTSSFIRFSHQSFAEFLRRPRTKEQPFYQIGESQSESCLASCCLSTMNTNLKFNICNISTHHDTANSHNEYHVALLEKHVGHSLRYAAQYFASHLVKCEPSSAILKGLQCFFNKHLLNWLELMSLLGLTRTTTATLQLIYDWLTKLETSASTPTFNLLPMVTDAVMFTSYFSDCMEKSALHVYLSALTFSPAGSCVAKHYTTPTFSSLLTSPQRRDWPTFETTENVESSHTQVGRPVFKKELAGVENFVYCAAFTPDGTHVVTGSRDGAIRLWDAMSGELVRVLTGHTMRVIALAISPDGTYIVSGSEDKSARVWDFDAGHMKFVLTDHTEGVTSVAVSSDGRHIVSGSHDKILRVWTTDSMNSPPTEMKGHTKPITAIAVSPDGKLVVSASEARTLRLWNLETYKAQGEQLKGHGKGVYSVAFSPDCTRIASGSRDATIRIWNTATQQLLGTISDVGFVMSIAFSPDGQDIAFGSTDQSVRVWCPDKGTTMQNFLGHLDTVFTVAFSPDGRHIVSGSRDQNLRLWSVNGHTDVVSVVAYSLDGKYIASASQDGSVRIWNIKTKAVRQLVVDSVVSVTSLAFSPDGKQLAAGYEDQSIRVWLVATAAFVAENTPSTIGPAHAITSILFSSNGQGIMFGSANNTIFSWSMKPTEESSIQMYAPLENTSRVMAISPDGLQVAVTSPDHTSLRLYSIKTGEALQDCLPEKLSRISCVFFSSDKRYIAFGSDTKVCMWNVQTQEVVFETLLDCHPLTCITISSDGTYIASGSAQGNVCIWSVDSGELVCGGPLEGHLKAVRSVAFSPDGMQLVSGSDDHAVRLWDLSDPKTMADSKMDWKLSKDGWVTGSMGELLLYVPPVHRANLYRPRNIAVLGDRATVLDTSKLAETRSLQLSTLSGPA